MEFRIYKNSREFFRENGRGFECGIRSYDKLNTRNYAFKFTDGEDCLSILKAADDMRLYGAERLAQFAADTVADHHLEVGNATGEEGVVNAFNAAYKKRLGGSRRQALFAGGCFWCMAKPYYEYDGIDRVFSGYAGGETVNPTYEQVKTGTTGHRETVMLEYDGDVISFERLLDIYFDTIDPFDDGGQFIDRGENYTCAIFTDDEEELKIIAEFIAKIERECNRKVQVKILGDTVFYKAEEYHQDYALKNPDKMEEELKNSGRLK